MCKMRSRMENNIIKYSAGLAGVLLVYLLGVFYFVTFDISQWTHVGRFLGITMMPSVFLAVVNLTNWNTK